MRTVPASASIAPTVAVTVSSVASSAGTGTGRVKRAPYSRIAPGSPIQSVTALTAVPMVSMPWAMTPSRPTDRANSSL